MKPLIAAVALLVLATPAVAGGHTATAAQWKDIRTLQHVFIQCGGSDDPDLKEPCALSSKLQDKLGKQGFCFYKRILPGRPGKDGCEPLSNPPPQ